MLGLGLGRQEFRWRAFHCLCFLKFIYRYCTFEDSKYDDERIKKEGFESLQNPVADLVRCYEKVSPWFQVLLENGPKDKADMKRWAAARQTRVAQARNTIAQINTDIQKIGSEVHWAEGWKIVEPRSYIGRPEDDNSKRKNGNGQEGGPDPMEVDNQQTPAEDSCGEGPSNQKKTSKDKSKKKKLKSKEKDSNAMDIDNTLSSLGDNPSSSSSSENDSSSSSSSLSADDSSSSSSSEDEDEADDRGRNVLSP